MPNPIKQFIEESGTSEFINNNIKRR